MSTFNIILFIYVTIVIITMPFIMRLTREVVENWDYPSIFSKEFVGRIIGILLSLVPIINLQYGFIGFRRWFSIWLAQRNIKRIARQHKGDEVGEQLNKIADEIKNINRLKE